QHALKLEPSRRSGARMWQERCPVGPQYERVSKAFDGAEGVVTGGSRRLQPALPVRFRPSWLAFTDRVLLNCLRYIATHRKNQHGHGRDRLSFLRPREQK